MGFFSRFNPFRALRDLRLYFHSRKPIELVFLFAALVGTSVIIGLFIIDSPPVPPKEKEIIYVQQWSANRSDAEIIAQQKKDKPQEDAEKARVAELYRKHQQELKKLDEGLKSWGL